MKHSRRLFCLLLVVTMLFGVMPVHAAAVQPAVSGLDEPQVGELIGFSAVSAQLTAYTVDEVCWYRASSGEQFDTVCQPGERFGTGKYLCRVYLNFAADLIPSAAGKGYIGGQEALLGKYRGRWFLECTYTAKPSTRISMLDFVGINAPEPDTQVGDYTAIRIGDAPGCTVTKIEWSIGGAPVGNQVSFRAGDQASCTVTVRANDGFRFADQSKATLCGKLSSAAVEQLAFAEYSFIFLFTIGGTPSGSPETIQIGSVALQAPPPVTGQTPAMPTLSDGVSLAAAIWSPAVETFAANTAYTLIVTLTVKSGYGFVDRPIVTLNGASVSLLSRAADSLTVGYTFPPTEAGYVFPFADVPADAWFYGWVERAHRMGLINGKSETAYMPDAEMTWAEAVKLAACMHQLYHDGRVTLTNGNPWYMSYLDYCLAQGIVSHAPTQEMPGYQEIYDRAGVPISRAAYVCLFSRALPPEALPAVNTIPDNAIPDVPVSDGILDDGIYLFYRAGILNGMDGYGTFSPDSGIRRSDVAAILVRMMDPAHRVGPPALLQ